MVFKSVEQLNMTGSAEMSKERKRNEYVTEIEKWQSLVCTALVWTGLDWTGLVWGWQAGRLAGWSW